MDENFIYENITLRNITIADPKFSYGQGIILGNPNTPMQVLSSELFFPFHIFFLNAVTL